MDNLLRVKPISKTTNRQGTVVYRFKDGETIGEVPLALFQIKRPLPDSIVVYRDMKSHGLPTYVQSRYDLLKQLYGTSGDVTLTVVTITEDPSMTISKLFLRDEYGFNHVYLSRGRRPQLRSGQRLSFCYRVNRRGPHDGYLALTSKTSMVEPNFLDPDTFIKRCSQTELVRKWFDKLQKDRQDAYTHKLKEQIAQRNNLWVFTFANRLKIILNKCKEELHSEKLYSIAMAYRSVEKAILQSNICINAFKEEKREEVKGRIKAEILFSWAIIVAIRLKRKGKIEAFMLFIERETVRYAHVSDLSIRLLVQLCNVDEEIVRRHDRSIARLLYDRGDYRADAVGAILCLHSILDGHVTSLINTINQEIHEKDAPVKEAFLTHIIRMIGIQLMMLDPRRESDVIRVKTVQLIRIISYLMDTQRARLLVKKAITLLSAEAEPFFTLEDFENTHINDLAEKLLHLPVRPFKEPLQYLGAGSVVFHEGQIRIIPLRQLLAYVNPTDVTTLHMLMDGKIAISTQNDPSAIKGTFDIGGEGWRNIYEMAGRKTLRPATPIETGVYPIVFNNVRKDTQDRAYFYVKLPGGEVYISVMYPNGLYSIPYGRMNDVFQYGDQFMGRVIKVYQETAVVSISQEVTAVANQEVSTGDTFLAQCVEVDERGATFYGINGALCCVGQTDKIAEHKYYLVEVTEMPPVGTRYVPIRVIRKSTKAFDALTVNRERIRAYITANAVQTGARVNRIYAGELMYLLDRMAMLSVDLATRYFYYQYIKMVCCIICHKLSFMYGALASFVSCRLTPGQSGEFRVRPEDIEKYPRLKAEIS